MTQHAGATSRTRAPIDRIGATVLRELVSQIVAGDFAPGETLPPEAVLSADFGVSRTVIRETVKRLQEKGMVTVAQGRGTNVNETHLWNVLDPLVLDTLIEHDSSLGVLDDLTTVRASLEGTMAAAAAEQGDPDATLLAHLDAMRASVTDDAAFRKADIAFHIAVMQLGKNMLATNVARGLLTHAVASDRYTGDDPADAFALTLAEHQRVHDAILAGDAIAARDAMAAHIVDSWTRRRLNEIAVPS